MSQNVVLIPNTGTLTGLALVNAVNAAMDTIASHFSGPADPGAIGAFRLWADTTNGVLRQRNTANTGWINRLPLVETLVVSRSANSVLNIGDFGRTINITSGSFTQTFNAAASMLDGWFVEYKNAGSGTVVLDPNGSELIDSVASVSMGPGESCCIYCDGTQFITVGRLPTSAARINVKQTYTAQQTPMGGTLTDAASITWDGDTNGQVVSVTTSAARAFAAPTNIVQNAMYKLILTSGGFLPSWATAFKWPGGTAPSTLTGLCIFNFVGGAGNTLINEGYSSGIA